MLAPLGAFGSAAPLGGERAKYIDGLLRTSFGLQKVPTEPACAADPIRICPGFPPFAAPARLLRHFRRFCAGRETAANSPIFRPPQKSARNAEKPAPGRQSTGFGPFFMSFWHPKTSKIGTGRNLVF